jgi:hypothetical protein
LRPLGDLQQRRIRLTADRIGDHLRDSRLVERAHHQSLRPHSVQV